jgi:hypothetical protein
MTPAAPLYQTLVVAQPDPLHANLVLVTMRLTIWEAMTTDGRARAVNAMVSELRRYISQAETATLPIPRDHPQPPAP